MTRYLNPPLVPKNGLAALIILVCRVSDPDDPDKEIAEKDRKQDLRSLDDQQQFAREWIKLNIDCPFELTIIAGSGSGELLDREEVQQLEDLVVTGEFDLVLTEDLGRIMRRHRSYDFCESSLDYGTRVIAINDYVDTFQEGWEERAIFAAMHHERSNKDTSRRIKRSLRHRFTLGEAEQLPIFGQIRPDKAKSDMDWHKDPAAEPIYMNWFEMLDNGASFAEVADWLNTNNVPTGPYCRLSKWDAQMVARISYNPILKGLRRHNVTATRRNSRGRYLAEKANPELLQTRDVPHLAFIAPDDYDRIVADLRVRNACYSRKARVNGHDVRKGVPRKRTRFPGQMVNCGICGRSYNYEGTSDNDGLKCRGASNYQCWNSVGLSGSLTTEKVLEAILAEVDQLSGFDPQLLECIQQEAVSLDASRDQRMQQLHVDERQRSQERDNLIAFIKDGRFSAAVDEELQRVEESLRQINVERLEIERQPRHAVEIPPMVELKGLAREALADFDRSDPEFQAVMRRMIPRLVVFPHKLCDGGHIVPRVGFRWTVAGVLSDPRQRELLAKPTEKLITVDVFTPPDRVLALPQVMAHADLSKPELESKLGIRQHTVKQARKLQAVMHDLGITDPYIPLLLPPDVGLKRHKHPRYRFVPLPQAGEV